MDKQRLADNLDNVLREPALHFIKEGGVDAAAQQAALNYGIALGACRVFGVELGELDGTMPPEVAKQALYAANRRIDAKMQDLTALEEKWKEAKSKDPDFGDIVLIYQFYFAMELDQFYIAVLESWLAQPEYDGLEKFFANTCEKISRFYWALDEHKSLLREVKDHPILNEWREHYVQEPFPAWLEA